MTRIEARDKEFQMD